MPVDANDAFTLILEPVKRCNLSCRYCYSDGAGAGIMSRQTLRTALEKTARYAERQGFREIHILWHGGEPLLAGLGFFRAAMKILDGLASDLRFHHYLQTNSLLLDHDFCAFSMTTGSRLVLASTARQSCTTRCGSVQMGKEATRRFWGKCAFWKNKGFQWGSTRSLPGGVWVRRRQSTGTFRAWGTVSALTR
jgi:hypothetical protein